VRKSFFLVFLIVLVTFSVDALALDLGGKKKIKALEEELSDSQEMASELEEKNAKLEEQLAEITAQLDQARQSTSATEAELEGCKTKLATEEKRGSGIKVVFFNGDIIYEIASDAFVDYRAGLRFHSLSDVEFSESLQLFEKGMGGDLKVLAAMKLIDSSHDRMISLREAAEYRRKAEIGTLSPASE